MKKCFKCNEVKDLDQFYAHPQMADGHLNKCKSCTRTDNKTSNGLEVRSCAVCSNSFRTRITEIRRGGGLTCSRRCYFIRLKTLLDDKYSGKRSYMGLHKWIERELGKPQLCEFCNRTDGKFEWSNISGTYKEDLTDWQRLCIKCHRNYDQVGTKGWITKRGMA